MSRFTQHLINLPSSLFLAALPSAFAPALPATEATYPQATEYIGSVRQIYDSVLSLEMAVNNFRNIDRLFPVRRALRS